MRQLSRTVDVGPRRARLGWSAICLVLFGVLATLVQTGWEPLADLDRRLAVWPTQFTREHDHVHLFWRYLAEATNTRPRAIVTVITAVLLAITGHRRAAVWTAGVISSVGLLTVGLKLATGRDRPFWEEPIQVLTTYSFPSGHSSGIAAAMGVVIVLIRILAHRRGVRRLVDVAAIVVVLLVGADRIFLGLHYLSDVVAGYLLGVGVLLFWLAVYDPKPAADRAGQVAGPRRTARKDR